MSGFFNSLPSSPRKGTCQGYTGHNPKDSVNQFSKGRKKGMKGTEKNQSSHFKIKTTIWHWSAAKTATCHCKQRLCEQLHHCSHKQMLMSEKCSAWTGHRRLCCTPGGAIDGVDLWQFSTAGSSHYGTRIQHIAMLSYLASFISGGQMWPLGSPKTQVPGCFDLQNWKRLL